MINSLQNVSAFGVSDVLREQAAMQRVVHELATADGEELEQCHVPRIDVAISMDLVQHSTRKIPRKQPHKTKKQASTDLSRPPTDNLGGYHINQYV
ncbi:MAG: hypothetical protein HQL58_13130 [Magnetococcales bacterium]|nr:hypothetical protein [Magnetococcales bacterium]